MKPIVYEGSEPYIFVSYAHKDFDVIFEVLSELQARGYRFWYDDGIAPGSEWPEDIAQHLDAAHVVVAFVTQNAMDSRNCRREINFSLSREKRFLSVLMEETEMPLGMQMQLSAQQSIVRYNYETWDGFINKLLSCPDLSPCRDFEAQVKFEQQRDAAFDRETTSSQEFDGEWEFGHWGDEPIAWRTIARQGRMVLAITVQALDCRRFDSFSNRWETCELRRWLEGEFECGSFSDAERCRMASHPFCLSVEEARQYFKDIEDRKCRPSAFAVKNGAWNSGSGTCRWWLRSPGVRSYFAAYVNYGGYVNSYGLSVNGGVDIAVRPAMWLTL